LQLILKMQYMTATAPEPTPNAISSSTVAK